MNYNLHPIFVHFPIAFFLLYSLLRLFPWSKKLPTVDWHLPRIVLLIAGLLGAWLANVTGEIASDLVRPDHALVEMHEGFAGASVNLYVVLLILELIIFIPPQWINSKAGRSFQSFFYHTVNYRYQKELSLLPKIQKLLSYPWLFRLLALVGAVLIAITGLLGGVMVYGVSADPLAAPMLKLLGL